MIRGGHGRGVLFVVSAPSGAGKTTLVNWLLEAVPELTYSVSTTTRAPRPGEQDGVDYRFTTKEDFEQGIASGRFVEWAEVHGNYYGTSARAVEEALSHGNNLLLDIDVQGARQLVKRFPEAVTVFIMPPSVQELRRRLENRGSDAPEVIERRLEAARWEMDQRGEYRHVVVNGDLKDAKDRMMELVYQYVDVGRKE